MRKISSLGLESLFVKCTEMYINPFLQPINSLDSIWARDIVLSFGLHNHFGAICENLGSNAMAHRAKDH